MMNVKILILDDNEKLFNKLKPLLSVEGITLIFSSNAEESKNLILTENIFLIIVSCSIRNAEDVVLASKANDLFRPIIITHNDESFCDPIKKNLLGMGVNAFYSEDFDITDLVTQSLNFTTLYHAKKDSKSQNDVFKTLTMALEVRDPYTHGHGERVAVYATTLYEALGFVDFEEKEALRSACIIHDIGKVGTPDNILKSSNRVDDEEFQTIKNHPIDGVRICSKIVTDPKVIDVIEHHHEKLDGSGYPDAYKGNEISKIVQMATISDVYDALTSDRSYRIRNTMEEALEIMKIEFINHDKLNKDYFYMFKKLLEETDSFDDIKYLQ